MGSQNIYEYQNINQLDLKDVTGNQTIRPMVKKINELVIGQNKMAKDLELYKKAYKELKIEFDKLNESKG